MDERETNLFMNLMTYGLNAVIDSLMGNTVLVARQLGSIILDERGHLLLEAIGIPKITGTNINEIMSKLGDALKSKEIVRVFDVIESSENGMKIKLGDCILAHAAKMAKEAGAKIPLCPLLGIMMGIIKQNTDQDSVIDVYEHIPEENAEIFHIKLL